ncbi:hypothetical protein KBA63_00525 [Candidatus Woesebacteria bacterium]|jgi:hypothetical protein|nr:hypothetical protein [Candidatus Woesebacteria bacterium]
MKPSLITALTDSKSLLVLLPKNPYFDQVAAATSLYLGLSSKYEVTMVSPVPMVVEYNRLVGVEKISTEIGNKNLVIKVSAATVERVFYETDGVDLMLTMVPKQGAIAPKPEDLRYSMSGVAADTVILLGGANESHFPALAMKDLSQAKLIHIGRESVTIPGRDVLSLATSASTISEVVARLFEEAAIEVDGDCATNLLMGITEGSRNFVGPDVTAHTFRVMANLLDRGGKRMPARVAPQNQMAQTPGMAQPQAPKSWLEPKIYKGTTVS